VVRPGDYLALIASEYGTTVNAILALNPQITNSSYLYPGEVLTIPAYGVISVPTEPVIPLTGTFAEIVPNSGPQGTYVQVVVNGFPANTSIQIGLHKLNRKLIESTADATTDAYGTASVTMRIPTGQNINNNRVWLAQVTTTSGSSLTVNSNPFYVTGN
jgi:LysM repeat protein